MLKKYLHKKIPDLEVLELYRSRCKITSPKLLEMLSSTIRNIRCDCLPDDPLLIRQSYYGNTGAYFRSLVIEKRNKEFAKTMRYNNIFTTTNTATTTVVSNGLQYFMPQFITFTNNS